MATRVLGRDNFWENSLQQSKQEEKIVPNSLLPYSVYLKTLSLNYLSCQQIWVKEKEKDRENEKAGARLAKLNEKKSEKELDNGGETSLTSNV